MKSLIVGTAGHIDHGKSSLIRCLTGTDPDRLKEEKERGITIDLGFAHMQIDDTQVGFVDVPGHERFVRNMLAGASGMDAVLFVVAADESVMPQTREHLDICHLLGIQQGIFVVTKIDLVDREMLPLVKEEIEELARNTSLRNAPVVCVSNATEEGMDAVREALRTLARQAVSRTTCRLARLPIDRVFTLRGFGTVVTGTLYSGQLKREQTVQILPGTLTSKIRGLQTYGQKSEIATEGQRTAVNLQGVDKQLLARGMTVTVPGRMRPSRCLDATLYLVRNAANPLQDGDVARLHIGTQETLARVLLLAGGTIEPEQSGLVQLRTQRPVCAWMEDRFILRRVSPASTIGGGEILDPAAYKRKRHASIQKAQKLANSRGVARLREWILAEKYASEETLTALTGYPAEYLAQHLASQPDLALVGDGPHFYCSSEFLQDLSRQLWQRVDEFQQANPLAPGMKKEELRTKLPHALPHDLFHYALHALRREGKLLANGEFLSVAGRSISLSLEDQGLYDCLERLLEASGVQPPSIRELLQNAGTEERRGRNMLFLLQQRNIAVRITEDLFIHRSHLERVEQQLRGHFPPGSQFNVGQFKDLLGITRKYAIPLLEYFDRQRITRRAGDVREMM
ncbi:MAG: selenocysteine-specific translation elongation factor [Acidobacteria bacterium]|nr:selenocysteine-specific translation elongation factor [Acidobacteriota bacterium]